MMRIERIGEISTVMSNPESLHNYFAWPSVARLKNGRIAVAASGYRLAHVCPFGKSVMAVSEDEGKTFSSASPVIDTALDDRDAGLCAFGESGLILTSFNNTVEFQRKNALTRFRNGVADPRKPYTDAYLDMVTPEKEAADHGATFRVSYDNGITFGPIYKSPITSPHGPVELSNGRILWLGRVFDDKNMKEGERQIRAYEVNPENGACTFLGAVDDIYLDGEKLLSVEPYALELPDGKILCHIRAQRSGERKVLTLYQAESTDGGRTWTAPHRIIGLKEGAPSHLLLHSSGTLICAYSHREMDPRVGIHVIFSKDCGETWSEPYALAEDFSTTPDIGYPCSVELSDHSIYTVFYAHAELDSPAEIFAVRWRVAE